MKRKVRTASLLVGLIAVAIFGYYALGDDASRADQVRLSAIDRIAKSYGFKGEVIASDGSTGQNLGTVYTYCRAPMDSKAAARMMDEITTACSGMQYRHEMYDDQLNRVPQSNGEPFREAHLLFPLKGTKTWFTIVDFVPHERFTDQGDADDQAMIRVCVRRPSGVLDLVRSWLSL